MAKLEATRQFFTIDPMSLVKDRELTFDVYILLPLNERMIVYRRKGTTIEDMQLLLQLRERGLQHFHILENDRDAYNIYVRGHEDTIEELEPQTSTERHAPEAQAPEAQAPETQGLETRAPEARELEALKSEVPVPAPAPPPEPIEYVPTEPAEKLMEGLLASESENLEAKEKAKEMVLDILKASGADQAMSDILENPATEHASSVAIYATLFAMGLKKNDQQTLQDVIIASLLHDIGFTQIPPEILNVPRTKQNATQKTLYEQHLQAGLALLIDLDYTPNKRVISLLSHHHEKFNGTGFPAHLESFRIDEIAQLIGIADLIDSLARGKHDGTKRSLNDALLAVAQIERTTTFPEYFNPDTFKKVMKWLQQGGGKDYIAAAETAVQETKRRMLKAS